MISTERMAAVRQRMQSERNIWMATTRPDGRPHVAPLWFVWHDDRAYVMTGGVKLANVRRNGLATLNTEDGNRVVIIEGTARVVPQGDTLFEIVAELFQQRYDWDIRDSVDRNELIEVTPVKVITWNT
jgi:nitroimidazol reductase NimA-like FMN-containing flavoprotein (pyridoxamine 5'-phosphate oxidase superfamily)